MSGPLQLLAAAVGVLGSFLLASSSGYWELALSVWFRAALAGWLGAVPHEFKAFISLIGGMADGWLAAGALEKRRWLRLAAGSALQAWSALSLGACPAPYLAGAVLGAATFFSFPVPSRI